MSEEKQLTNPYRDSLLRRMKIVLECNERDSKNKYTESAVVAQAVQLAMCAKDPVYFISNFCMTYNPKLAATSGMAFVPFDPWPRQIEFLNWLHRRVLNKEVGLCEKSRDVGFTFLCAAYVLNRWLFVNGFKATFASRKLDLVDKLGDIDSIMEKVRMMLDRLPDWMKPPGYEREKHSNWTKISNVHNNSIITGESGEQIGRGGRSSIVIIDEAAFIENAESAAAALVANADCRIWGSSANGPGNYFARLRHDGTLRDDQIFTLAWDTDPNKDLAWFNQKRRELASNIHIFYSEYLIDFNASVEGICIPGAWVNAALELGKLLPPETFTQIKQDYPTIAGLDIGDGIAESVYTKRQGPLIYAPKCWTKPDSTETAYSALEYAREDKVNILNFDTIGVGKGVLSILTHAMQDALDPTAPTPIPQTRYKPTKITPVNTGMPASWQYRWPDGLTSRQKCLNIKSEIWLMMREGFRCAAEHLAFLTNNSMGEVAPQEHKFDEILIFDPNAPPNAFRELIVQISTPKRTYNQNGKIQIESKQQLATRGVASPDRAEALSLTFSPISNLQSIQSHPTPMQIPGHKIHYPELTTPGATSPAQQITTPSIYRPPAVATGTPFDSAFSRDW